MGEFFSFEEMMTPTLIRIVFVLGVIGLVISGLTAMSEGGIAVILGIGIIVFGSLFLRVICESFIVVFEINDKLTDIRQNTRAK